MNQIPDLGRIAQQQIQVLPSLLARDMRVSTGVEFIDATTLVEMLCVALVPVVHVAIREEFKALGLLEPAPMPEPAHA